ncbi:MAG: hypothetical protein ABIS20_12435, partial [Thermoanaerobaculia bacterium]
TRASLSSGPFLAASSMNFTSSVLWHHSAGWFIHLFPGTMDPVRSGSAVMEAAGEPPPGKEPVMRVPRKAAVLVLLALSLGTSGLFAAKAPSEGRPAKTATRSAAHLFDALWGRVTGVWIKEGCRIDPLGRCSTNPAPQTQPADAGCGSDPLGRCSPGQ